MPIVVKLNQLIEVDHNNILGDIGNIEDIKDVDVSL
jgi:hypothetical protein